MLLLLLKLVRSAAAGADVVMQQRYQKK